jgi:hypothetical protein
MTYANHDPRPTRHCHLDRSGGCNPMTWTWTLRTEEVL